MDLATAFAESARRNAAKTAIYWGETEVSYEILFSQAGQLASVLRQQFAVRSSDRVAVWLKNSPEFVSVLFGILRAGAVVVPINNFLKPDEVAHIVKDAGIQVMITDRDDLEARGRLGLLCPELKFWEIERFREPHPFGEEPGEERKPSDLAVIIYTSGTTGRPKGAMLSHSNLLANVESCRKVLEAVGEDRFVVLLPMFHSFMLCVGILLPMLTGGSMVLIKSVHPPRNVLQEIMQRNATILPAVPQFFRTFCQAPLPDKFPLRLCISGGAPLPGEILKEFSSKMPFPLLEGYGLSEASPVVTFNPIRGPWKPGSIGVPISGVEVTVQDDTGRMLNAGETGEICVRGANVMQGYWNQAEETAKVMRDGWLLTGDIGHCDAGGYFFITDRKKDMLLVNGINVYPREIEEVLYQFPGVKEAAVIGEPDARKGEQPVAFVSPVDGTTLEERPLQHFLREKLANYKVPRRIHFLPALPRNATGKVLKTALRELSRQERSQSPSAD